VSLTVAFFTGRLVSYSLYIGVVTIAAANLGQLMESVFTSPYSWVVEIALLGVLLLLTQVNWAARLHRHGRGSDRSPSAGDAA
jgi:hypothetical protein